MSIVTQRIYTGDSIVYVGENGGGGGVSNSHTIASPGGINTVAGPFAATSNIGNNGTAHHSLFDANGNSIGYPVPEMPGGPQYVLSADNYGGMAWALFASKIQAALSSSDGSVTFTPTGSGSDVTVNVKVIHDTTLTGNGSAESPLSISNPSYYIKGNTVYGGTLTDNLNTLVRNTPFTCLGTATGVPDASYSWFGWHINSNADTAAAVQTAYAYNSSPIICYERVKSANTWGNWILRGSVWPMTTFESGALLAYPGILYVGSAITNFILTLAPSIGGEYHIKFTTASTIGMINLTAVTSWIGSVPTVEAGKTYELDILDNVGVMAEVS